MRYYRYILGTLGTFEASLVHRWYINVSSLYRFQAQKRYIYSFIHVPILYQIGHISDIFGNPVQNRYTFFVPVKMYQFCTFFRCGGVPVQFFKVNESILTRSKIIIYFSGWTSAHDPRKPPTEVEKQRAKVH